MKNSYFRPWCLRSTVMQHPKPRWATQALYKDRVRVHLKACEILMSDWESSATDRSNWREVCSNSIHSCEEARLDSMNVRRQQRKEATSSAINPLRSTCTCDTCKRICHSRIWLYAHAKRHGRDSSHVDAVPLCLPVCSCMAALYRSDKLYKMVSVSVKTWTSKQFVRSRLCHL